MTRKQRRGPTRGSHHPKPYWRSISRDLAVLFEMLVVADRREDWHAFLEQRSASS
jgi:hypothetical protein